MELFEEEIRKGLYQKASQISPSDELLSKITNEAENNPYTGSMYEVEKFKKAVVISLISALLAVGTLFTLSASVRAAAIGAVSNIKTVFVKEKYEDGYRIVEKKATEVPIYKMFGRGTDLTDDELSKKVGFKFKFPEKLAEEFSLDHVSEGVILKKSVPYDVAGQLDSMIESAVEDQASFDKLKDYKPVRFVDGMYYYGYRIVFININKIGNTVTIPSGKKVQRADFDKYEAYYVNDVYPDYPDNNMENKPESFSDVVCFKWYSDDLEYVLTPFEFYNPSLEEAKSIAASFMKSQ